MIYSRFSHVSHVFRLMMEHRFRQLLQKESFVPDCSLLLAVSGGVDSVVLFDLLVNSAKAFGLRLQVFHLDHQIRPEAAADADFVRSLCASRNIPCCIESVDVPALAGKRRLSLETAGREARREWLLHVAEEEGCERIVVAHHQDDQAETFLQRLLRGTGISGLQAMRSLSGIWWRPLLGFSREQIVEYARRHQLEWVEDETNRDVRYLRNRIRHDLLPQLREYNPQICSRLATLSRQFQREEDYWQQQVDLLWPRLRQDDADGLRLDLTLLQESHPALQLRLLREGLKQLRGDLSGIAADHLEALCGLLITDQPQAELDLPGCWAARRYRELWLRLSAPQPVSFDLPLLPGQPLSLPDGRVLLAEFQDRALGEGPQRVEFDATAINGALRVRSPQAGDSFRLAGMTGRRKIKDFLIDQKVEKEQRQSLPLLLDQQEILWLVGLRRSSQAPVSSKSQKILAVRLISPANSTTNPL